MFDFPPEIGKFVWLRSEYVAVMLSMSLLWAVMYVSMHVWGILCVVACWRHTRLQRMQPSRQMRVVERMMSRAAKRSRMLMFLALCSAFPLGVMLGFTTYYVAVASPVTRLIWGMTWLCGMVMS